MTTSYRQGVERLSSEEQVQNILKKMEEFGEEGVRLIWNDNEWRNYIKFFRMEESYCRFLNVDCGPKDGSLPFYRQQNLKTIRKLAHYVESDSEFEAINLETRNYLLNGFTWRFYNIDKCNYLMFAGSKVIAKYIEDFSVFDDPKRAREFFNREAIVPHPCFGGKHRNLMLSRNRNFI